MADKAYIGEPQFITPFKKLTTPSELAFNSVIYEQRVNCWKLFGQNQVLQLFTTTSLQFDVQVFHVFDNQLETAKSEKQLTSMDKINNELQSVSKTVANDWNQWSHAKFIRIFPDIGRDELCCCHMIDNKFCWNDHGVHSPFKQTLVYYDFANIQKVILR